MTPTQVAHPVHKILAVCKELHSNFEESDNEEFKKKSKSEMIHDKAKIRSAKKFYYDAKNPRKTEKQKLLLHYKKKDRAFSVKIQSVSVMRTMCCVVL